MGRRRSLPPCGPRRVTRSQSQKQSQSQSPSPNQGQGQSQRQGQGQSQLYNYKISDLPDDLLRRVLSRLGCTRAAARAGVLSSQWRGLWTGVDEVAIRGLAPKAIRAALAKLTVPVLKSLDIDVSTRLKAAGVSSLLHAAARLSPGKLAFTVPGPPYDRDIAVDLTRLNSATSIKLDVPGVVFVLPPATEFPELETLSLSGCAVDLATLAPRCPKLRVLSVTNPPSSLSKIKVHSASLQELVLNTLEQCDIDIAAPALKKLTLSCNMGTDGSLSVVAPMVEEISLSSWYFSMYVELCEMWRVCLLDMRTMESKGQGKLTNGDEGSDTSLHLHQDPRAHILSLQILVSTRASQRNFAEEMKELPAAVVSVLELKISTMGHVFGPMMMYLLGIYNAVEKLDMILLGYHGKVEDTCFRRFCNCEEVNEDWRDETISLTSLTEVEIKGCRGDYDEIDFVGLLFRCAPMLQTMTVKVRDEIIPRHDWYNMILDTFQQYPSVDSKVYLLDA